MKRQSKSVSWMLFTDNLEETSAIVDNELEKSQEELKSFEKAHLFGLTKKRGFGLRTVMFAILIWPSLNVRRPCFFSAETGCRLILASLK